MQQVDITSNNNNNNNNKTSGGGVYVPWTTWTVPVHQDKSKSSMTMSTTTEQWMDSWTSLEEEEDSGSGNDGMSVTSTSTSLVTTTNTSPAAAAATLEGVLYWRKGKKSRHGGSKSSSMFWKRRYIVLDFADQSVAAYRISSGSSIVPGQDGTDTVDAVKLYHKRALQQHSRVYAAQHNQNNNNQQQGAPPASHLTWYISCSDDWHVKDIANDSSCFVLEVFSDMALGHEDESSTTDLMSTTGSEVDFTTASYGAEDDDDDDEDNRMFGSTTSTTRTREQKRQPSLRFYFKCPNGGNEKVLWLKAFAKLERLSSDLRVKKTLLSNAIWKAPKFTHSRTRTFSSAALARESLHLEQLQVPTINTASTTSTSTSTSGESITTTTPSPTTTSTNSQQLQQQHSQQLQQQQLPQPSLLQVPRLHHGYKKREREYRVIPERCYPNLWMTNSELLEEMEKPSETVFDLAKNPCRLDLPNNPSNKNTIGTLHLEVLQGLKFPKLDRYSKTDSVVYVVSGPYAFCTEVIKDKQSPIWLPKSQRACSIPLHHAYARIYIGVFDDEKNTRDDFNGRVVLDVARLRPNSTYDVTLPLRLSAHVYSRRKRGAIRIRFRLEWTSVRSALMSYLPDPIIPKWPWRFNFNLKEFKPNTDTVVPCGSARAFRNVAITVHGAHLPGRFSFQQLRATIREINFTRKAVIQIIRTTIVELREWQNPLISAFVFAAWMHCIWTNAFSLVPAYVGCYCWILLMRNYARYGMDGPAQRGCIPPSWEELLRGLLLAHDDQAIRPLDMGFRASGDGNDGGNDVQYRVQTHEPRGKAFFRAIGFLDEDENNDMQGSNYDLEFPYADSSIYPRFNVEHSLVTSKKSWSNSKTSNHAPKGHRQRLKLGISKLMRKDTSGMNDYDDEEQRFATGKFIRQSGATQLMGAAHGLKDVGETLGEATGLQYVVSPVIKGGQYVVSPVIKGGQSAVMGGLHYVVPPIKSGIKTGYTGIGTGIRGINNHVVSPLVVSPLHHTVDLVRRTYSSQDQHHYDCDDSLSDADFVSLQRLEETDERQAFPHRSNGMGLYQGHGRMPSIAERDVEGDEDSEEDIGESGDESNNSVPSPYGSDSSADPERKMNPDQDIDFEGAGNPKDKNRKRLTDDLQDVKDQMHQFTFQTFNDSAYVVMNSDSHYFGAAAPARRRDGGIKKDLNKLLQIGQYSHSNPVVGRVGQYVEPIVGASHSFLSAFRALFNVLTWRDPFLTFWVSLLGFALVVLLFVFPWRLFLFVVGLWFVGPQNFVRRILRQRGILPPKKPRARPNREPREIQVPPDQVVFQGHISQDQRRRPHKPVDPRQVQYVAVPYSPLMYQRFYDWPPEQEYSQVFSQDNVTSDAFAESNGYFSSSVEEGKKTK